MSGQDQQKSGVSPTDTETLASGEDEKPSAASPVQGSFGRRHASDEREDVSIVEPPNEKTSPRGASDEPEKPFDVVCSADVRSAKKDPPVVSGERSGASSVCPRLSEVPDDELDQGAQIYNPPDEEVLERPLILCCDPRGHPFEISDFREALQTLGIGDEIAGMSPMEDGNKWLLQLKTTEALDTLAKAGSVTVKGQSCAIVDPSARKVSITVRCAPFTMPNENVRRVLREYGTVERVTCGSRPLDDYFTRSAIRRVDLHLKEGLNEKDIPRVLDSKNRGESLVVVQEKPSLCLKCRESGHTSHECQANPGISCRRLPRRGTCRTVGRKPTPRTNGSERERRSDSWCCIL
ncbi:hypothetical protein HPB52_009197 [Rhipicephalus sanguineus]|uniref:CCHC-type domain-containing protein n=1 Tax=Rhipicephalus sanguineus TaxID=34632 RepID=A0A9D4SS36_RHISA|nr:hypothetical protein HPB52_009197 [Rhipicephalus sanguineus]